MSLLDTRIVPLGDQSGIKRVSSVVVGQWSPAYATLGVVPVLGCTLLAGRTLQEQIGHTVLTENIGKLNKTHKQKHCFSRPTTVQPTNTEIFCFTKRFITKCTWTPGKPSQEELEFDLKAKRSTLKQNRSGRMNYELTSRNQH